MADLARDHAERTGTPEDESRERLRALAWEESRLRLERGDYVEAYNWESITGVAARALGGVFDGSFAQMTRDAATRMQQDRDRSLLYPGSHEILAALRDRGCCLLLLTNGFRDYQLPMVQALGLAGYFTAVLASDDLQSVKPRPEAFERAFRHCDGDGDGSSAARYHIGDTLTQDVEGARAAGITAVWIYRELPREIATLSPTERAETPAIDAVLRERLAVERRDGAEVENARPDAVVVSLEEIGELIP